MDALDDVALLQIAVLQQDLLKRDVEEARKRKRTRRPRRYQAHPRLTEESRRLYGHYARLMEELRIEDPQSFFNYLRMEPATFDELVQRVGPRIEKQDTNTTKVLPTGLKLAITVRFLASGDKYPSLMYSFRVARNAISVIIPDVCQAIVEEYKNEVITCPTVAEKWTGTYCGGFWRQVECSSCYVSSGWQACGYQETCQEWFLVLQLYFLQIGTF